MKTRSIILDNITIPDDCLYFDIETTGLSSRRSQIYLIGALSPHQSGAVLTQWFAESMSDEKAMLVQFNELCGSLKRLVSYNGEGFDIPFIRGAMSQYAINEHISGMESLDIYAHIRRMKELFSTPDMTLKSMERFIGICREDTFSGSDLIAVYKEYLSSRDERLLGFLLLHNAEDVKNLPALASLLSYEDALTGPFEDICISYPQSEASDDIRMSDPQNGASDNIRMSDTTTGLLDGMCTPSHTSSHITFSSAISQPVPVPVSYNNQDILLSISGDKLSITVQTQTGTMKHFFRDYRSYFYLPQEDTAIHKSVGMFIDRASRQKATPATAYIKKSGTFLPISREMSADDRWKDIPCFCREYKERIPYILIDTDILSDPAFLHDYMRYAVASLGLLRSPNVKPDEAHLN